MRKREVWVDYAKAIGILLIVFGHLPNSEFVSSFIWTFHVPLFFFISGYLINTEHDAISYSKKIILRLVIPFIAMYLALELMDAIRYDISYKELGKSIKAMLYGSNAYPGFVRGQMWFFPSIITVSLLFFFLVRKIPFSFLILLGISIYFYSTGVINTFLSLDLSLLGLNFYVCGFLFKRVKAKEALNKMKTIFWLPGLIVFYFALLDFAKIGNVWYGGDKYMFSFFGALFGIAMVLFLSEILARIIKGNRIVRFLSNNTLFIMAFHLEAYPIANKFMDGVLTDFPILHNLGVCILSTLTLVPFVLIANWLIPELVGMKRKPINFL